MQIAQRSLIGSNPLPALWIFSAGKDIVAGQAVPGGQLLEAAAIVPAEPFVSADPKITFTICKDGVHDIGGQTLFRGVMDERNGLRVKHCCTTALQQQQEEKKNDFMCYSATIF
nr:hypothetical protein [Taibaiella helva]